MEDYFYSYLRVAKLEQYYPNFVQSGITRSSLLTNLKTRDYYSLGIKKNHDQKKLFQLIDIIRSLDTEEGKMGSLVHERQPLAINNGSSVQAANPSSTGLPPGETSPEEMYRKLAGKSQSQVSRRQSQRQRSSHSESDGDKKDDDFDSVDSMRRSYHPSSAQQSSYFGSRKLKPVSNIQNIQIPNYSYQDYVDDEDFSPDDVSPSFHSGFQPSSPNTSFRVRKANQHSKHGDGQPYNYGLPNSSPTLTRKVSKASNRNADKIRVCVRKRPMLKREKREDTDIVRVAESTVVVHEEKSAVDMSKYSHKHEYLFDEVYSEKDDNRVVFERSVRPLIQHVVNGGKSTCFAYGQTGSGKTHTIMGGVAPQNPGLYLLAGDQLFRSLRPGQLVYVAYFEIYCGQLYDLLNNRAKLHAREDAKQRVNISNLRESRVNSIDDLLALVAIGSRNRSVGQSGVNPDSSRSHAVLQIQLKSSNSKRSDSGQGRMSFIDLAGSERAAEAGDQNKQTRQEGAEINTSLLALKECIRALDQDSKHTPFRQSKLTQVLKESFIGDSKTCMIANISPTATACDNTLNTLRYADRVKQLKAQCVSTNIAVSSGTASSTRSSSPKFTRKVKSLVSAAQSPHLSIKEPNRASRKKRLAEGSSERGIKRSNSDISTTTMTTFNAITIDDTDNTEMQRSKSVESLDDDFTLNEDPPRPRIVAPAPQQVTIRLGSPVSVSSGSASPSSEQPIQPVFIRANPNEVRGSEFSVAENEAFAANYLHHYARKENTTSTRKSVSSPDLRRDSEPQPELEEPQSSSKSTLKESRSKLNPASFLKSIKSSKTNSDTAEKIIVSRNMHANPGSSNARSPKSQRKIVKFFGIESSSYSEIDPGGADDTITENEPQVVIVSQSKAPKSASKRFSNSADDIRQAELSSSTRKTAVAASVLKSSHIGKLSFSDTRRRRSPSVSEDETSSPQNSNVNINRAASDLSEVQQPAPPVNSKPSRPNVRTTPRDRGNVSSFSAAKKMNLAEFAKQPPPKMGRGQGSFENLVQQQNQTSSASNHPTTPEEGSHKRQRSRHSSSGEDVTLTAVDSPRQNATYVLQTAAVSSVSSPANSSPEQTLSTTNTGTTVKINDQLEEASGQVFTRSQSMRSSRSNEQTSLSSTSNQRSRSQSPGSQGRSAKNDSKTVQSSSSTTPSSNLIHKAQTTLITAHKDHLTQVSKCCTKELNCLREMELGNKAFKDYVKQVESYLTRKQKAIAQMQMHLAEYTKLCEQANQTSPPN